MATRTVDESDGKRKCEDEREEARRDLDAAMARFAAAELACSGAGAAPAALLDRRLRTAALESALWGLRLAYGKDDTAPGPCPGCGGRSRLCRREQAAVDTALGRVSMEMARRSCRSCGRSWRPRQRLLCIEGSMTPTARRLAGLERRRRQSVLWLRCAWLDDYWDDRIAKLAARGRREQSLTYDLSHTLCFFILNPGVSPAGTFFSTIPTKGEGIRSLLSRASSRFAAASSSSCAKAGAR